MKESGQEKPQQHPLGKKRTRFLLRLLIYPLVVLVVLLLGAFLFLQTETARNAVKAFVEQAATQHLQADLQVGKISGSLLFDISLEQVRVSLKGDPILTAKRISASYLLPLLLTRILLLNEVEIDGMVLSLIREKDGSLNIATLLPSGEAPETSEPRPLPLTILVSRISILDTTVILTDRQTAAATVRRISNIRLAAGLKLSTDGVVSARVINLALNIDQPAISLAGLSGGVSYRPEKNRLDMKDIRVRLKETDITVNGSLDLDPAGIQFNLRSAIKTLSLPEIGQIFSVPALDRGRLIGTLQVKGKPERFFHEAHLDLDGMSLSSSGQIEWKGFETLGVDVSATIRSLDPSAVPLTDFKDISGNINSDIRLQGSDLNRTGRRGLLTIELMPSRISGYNLSAAKIEAAFDAGGIVIKDSFLAGPQGRIAVRRALADIFDPSRPGRLSLDASVQDLDPAVSGHADLSGKINLNVTATALLPILKENRFDPAAIIAEVSADIGPSRIQTVDVRSGRVKALWNGRDVEIKTLELSVAGSRLAVSGLLTPDARNSRLQFNVDLPDLQQVAPVILRYFPDQFPPGDNLDLKGQLKISGEFNGWWDRPELSVVISGSRFRYDQVSAGDFNVKATFQGPLDGFRATAASHAQNITINGTRIPRVDLALQLGPDIALADLSLEYEKGLAFTAKGRIDGWRRPTKKITIDAFRLTQAKTGRNPAAPLLEDITNNGPIRLTLTPDSVEIAALKLISKEAELSLAGSLTTGGRIHTTLSLNRLDIKRVPRIIEGQDKFSGIFSADMELTGTLARPLLQARIRVKDGFFSLKGESPVDVSFSDLNLVFGYDGSRALVKAALYRHQQKALDVNGQAGCSISLYPFRLSPPDKDLKIVLKAHGLKLSELPLPRWTGFNYEGLLALDLYIDGDLSAPAIKGEIKLQEGFLAPENKDPRDYAFSDLNIGLSYEAGKASVNAALYRKKQKFLDLSGRAALELSLVPFHFKPLDDDFRIDAAARNLKLSMLPIPRQAGIDFDALLNVVATATGSLSRPVISGSLSLQDGFLTLLNPALSYETVRAQVDFSPDGMVIKEFSLNGDTEGTLNIKGRINLEGLNPTAFDIHLTGENLFIPYQKAVTARIRPDLKLTGTPLSPFLVGILTITEGRVNLDQLSAQAPAEIQIDIAGPEKKETIEILEEPGAAKDFLRPLAADIIVAVPKNVWLKGQGVNAEMAGQVNLKKDPDKPFILMGSLNTVRGTFDFQNKLFKISRGNVDFIGLEEPNPNLDIQAETRISKVNIIIKITGTAEQMTLDLDSEPTMDRTDIISYLVFGKPASDLNQQQNLNAEQAALNLTGQLAANELKKILGDAFRLDVLTLESGSGDITQGSLALGKYVTPEVFVLYRHRFKVDEPDQVEVTYKINRNFSIETQLGDEKTSGIDFVWDFDF